MFYFARFILLAQLVKYDVRTTRKIKCMHAIFYHILLLSSAVLRVSCCDAYCSGSSTKE